MTSRKYTGAPNLDEWKPLPTQVYPLCIHGVPPRVQQEPEVRLESATGAPTRYLPGRKQLLYDCPTPPRVGRPEAPGLLVRML